MSIYYLACILRILRTHPILVRNVFDSKVLTMPSIRSRLRWIWSAAIQVPGRGNQARTQKETERQICLFHYQERRRHNDTSTDTRAIVLDRNHPTGPIQSTHQSDSILYLCPFSIIRH